MAKGTKHHVSFWFWFLALFVMWLPCIGLIMIVVWAFAGENESRKNFFRALIAWTLIFIAFWLGVALLGLIPEIQKLIQDWLQSPK